MRVLLGQLDGLQLPKEFGVESGIRYAPERRRWQQ